MHETRTRAPRRRAHLLPARYVIPHEEQFAFLGEEWQVPYTCVMGLVWNIILSAAAGEARAPPAQAPPAEERFVGKVRPTRAAEERAAVGAREKRE